MASSRAFLRAVELKATSIILEFDDIFAAIAQHRVREEVESGADGDGNAEKLSATLDVALGALKQKSAEDTVDINTYANRVKGLSR